MRGLVTIVAIAVLVGACRDGNGGGPTSTVASTVVTSTEPNRRLAGVPESEIAAFVTDELSVAADVLSVRFQRGSDGYAGDFDLVLDDPSEARATVACEEVSVFLASHPTVTGVSRVTVLRDSATTLDPDAFVVNVGVRPGDPGSCDVV